MKMKTIAVVCAAILCSGVCLARPCGHHSGGWHRPAPIHHFRHGGHWHHHGSYWGRGGCHFWPGFVGGIVGGALASSIVEHNTVVIERPAVVAAPTVVTQPVIVQQPVVQTVATAPVTQTQTVWVEGRYVDQVQANGSTIRVWQPGHYEQRSVIVQ